MIVWKPIDSIPVGYKRTLVVRDKQLNEYDYALIMELEGGKWFHVGLEPLTLQQIKDSFKEWAYL